MKTQERLTLSPKAPLLSYHSSLTLSLDKMDAILADNIFKRIFLNENIRISIQIALIFFS